MSDEQVQLDGEGQSLLAGLLATPVGRRSVLKAGLASAAALGAGSLGAPVADAAARKKRRRVETTDLQFALGHVHGVSRLTLHANGQRIALKRHTKASREALRRRGGLWRAADLSQLTHHVSGVKLPADRGILISVHGRRGRRTVLIAQMSHAPRAAVIAHARSSHRATKSFKHAAGSAPRLARLGLKPADIRSAQHVAQLATVVDEWTTATGLTSFHPNIANLTLTAETNSALLAADAIKSLSQAIIRLQNSGKDVADFPTAKATGGSDASITIEGGKMMTFTTFRLNPQKDKGFATGGEGGVGRGSWRGSERSEFGGGDQPAAGSGSGGVDADVGAVAGVVAAGDAGLARSQGGGDRHPGEEPRVLVWDEDGCQQRL